MKLHTVPLWGFKGGVLSYLLLVSVPVTAQITPDKTLPINSSIKNQGNTNRIEGGTIKGSNLFHSFEQFSVPTGSEAYFNNDINIQNIITRITGKPISNIDGILKTNGTANLLLINPNGIIFGNNAKLNIGGSFLATTASQINFADATKFSAKNPEPNPLLTISVPIGLEIESNAGAIFIQSSGHNLIGPPFSPLIRSSNVASLQVQPERTLAIVGGDVILEGGVITSEGGRIEKAGSLTISTSKLIVRDGGRVDASTLASGEGGSVTINAFKSVEVSGKISGSGEPSSVISSANIVSPTFQKLYRLPPAPSGKSGNVTINTGQLSLTEGASVNVRNDGFNDAGTLKINAASVSLNNKSAITATTSSGEGGNIFVNTRYLQLSHNSAITATAGSRGNGGNININADILTAWEKSNITANAFEGRGGNIEINTPGLFISNDSKVLANSEKGVDGRVQFIGVVELRSTDPKPETVRETSKITSACEARPGVPTGRFVITGTGSPPPILKEKTSDNVAWQDNSNLVQKADNLDEIQLPTEDIKPIVEANTWILNPNGQVQLIAKYNTGSSDLRLYANACFTEHFSNQSSSMSEIVNNKND